MGAGAGLIVVLVMLAGPFIALGVWLWLRSRREPIALVEPLDIGRVLSIGFRVFTPEGWPVTALAAVLIGIPQIVTVLVTRPMMLARTQQLMATNPTNPFAAFEAMMTPAFIVSGLVGIVLMMAFYVAATIFLVSRAEARPISIGDALGRTPARILPAIGALILMGIGIAAGWMLFLLPGVILTLNWALIIPVVSCEDAGFFGNFRRSRSLALGSRGRILLLLLLVFVVVLMVSVPVGILAGSFSGHATNPGFFASTWNVVVGTLLAAFQSSLWAGLYVELRRIRDGLSAPGLAEVFA